MSQSPEELLIGAHMSIAGAVYEAPLRGQPLGTTTIQIFTANQKQWKGKPISKEDADLWHENVKKTHLKTIMSHSSYLINLGSNKPDLLAKSIQAFKEEISRCIQLDLAFLNFHPGAATGDTKENCLDRIASSLLECASSLENTNLRLLLEATAGQGTVIGSTFEELSYIIEKVKDKIPIGVCIDTCHIFAAGYDIRTKDAWNKTLEQFDSIIGLKHLFALHVNDSQHPLNSKKDRHASLGQGEIGTECFKVMMTHPKLKEIPKYLETPNGEVMWKDEIAMLRKFAKE